MTVSPLRPTADLSPHGLILEVAIVREDGRGRCARCRIRRVLYRIAVAGGASEARCAECWGVRP